MKIRLPAAVKMILDSLHAAGFEAYAAGECVRDSVLGKTPEHWDIVSPALPEQVRELFPDTGGEEIPRAESRICFCERGGILRDLGDRAFTVNAMAYSEEEGLLDPYGGMEDLQRKTIRCVGEPGVRFSEDALLLMQAVRYAAQLGFSVSKETSGAVRELAGMLAQADPASIGDELVLLLVSGHPEYLKTLWELGITKIILPEFDRMMQTPQNTPYHYLNVGEHTIASLLATPRDAERDELRLLRLTMLLHDAGKPLTRTTDKWGIDHFRRHADTGVAIADEVLQRFRIDGGTAASVKTLILYHDWRIHPVEKEVARLMEAVGTDLFPYLIQVQYADAVAQSDYIKEQTLRRITEVFTVYRRMQEEKLSQKTEKNSNNV